MHTFNNINAYGLKCYWKDNKYYEEKIDDSDDFKELSDLLKN